MVDLAGIGAEPCSVAGNQNWSMRASLTEATVVSILTGNVLKDPDA